MGIMRDNCHSHLFSKDGIRKKIVTSLLGDKNEGTRKKGKNSHTPYLLVGRGDVLANLLRKDEGERRGLGETGERGKLNNLG